MQKMIEKELADHAETLQQVKLKLMPQIEQAATMVVGTLNEGGKVLFCGNGGSAADAQHLAAELSGRYTTNRKGLAGLALTTDSSVLTAVSNDFGYQMVFARQVQALAKKGDLLIGISTSGNSPNVLEAFKMAQKVGCQTIAFTGRDGGKCTAATELNVIVPANETARIQEMHILIGHIICQAVDNHFKE